MKWFKRLSRESSVNLNDKVKVLVNEDATLRINESHDICYCEKSSVKNDNENDICHLCLESNSSESIMNYNNIDKLDKILLRSSSSSFASPGVRAEGSVTLGSAAATTMTTNMEKEFMYENSHTDTDADDDDDANDDNDDNDDDDGDGKNNDSKLKKSVVSFDNKLNGVKCRLFKCKLCLKQKEEHNKESGVREETISNPNVPTTKVIQSRLNEITSSTANSFSSNHDKNITYKITTNKCSRNNIKFCEIKKVKHDLSDGGLRKRVKNLESIILLSDGDSSSLSSAASSLSSTSSASTSGAILSSSHRGSPITTINSRNPSIPFEGIRSSLLAEQQVDSDTTLREIIDPDDFFDDPDEVNKYLEEQILSEWEFIDCPILKKKTDTIKVRDDDVYNVDEDDDNILNISCHSFTSSNFDNLLFESSSDSETSTTSRSSSSAEGNLVDDNNKNSDNDDSFDCSSYEKIGRSPSVLSLRSYEEDTFGLFYLCDSTIFRLSEASYHTTSYLFEKDICNGLNIDYFNDIVIEEDIYYESVNPNKDANTIRCSVSNNSASLFFKQTDSNNLLSVNKEDVVQPCRVNAFAYSLMGPLLVQDEYFDPLILLDDSELKEQNTSALSSASAGRQTELQEISEEGFMKKAMSSRNTNNNNSNSTFCVQQHFGLNDSGDIVIHLDHIIIVQGYTMPMKKSIKRHMKHIPKGIEVFEDQTIKINWRNLYNDILAYLCENLFGKYSIILAKDFIIHYHCTALHYFGISIYISLFFQLKLHPVHHTFNKIAFPLYYVRLQKLGSLSFC